MTRIVTIEREYGCGAAEIAKKLATRLGWRLWDDELTREIARLAHCPDSLVKKKQERRDPLYYRLLKSFARGSYEGSINADDPLQLLDADSLMRVSERVVRGAAEQGNCVIVGRGSQHFLQDREDTLRFFLYAPKTDKVRRLMSQGNEAGEASDLVDTVDRERAAFIRQYFKVAWPNRPVYHAMLNTSAGDEAVVRAIMTFVERGRTTPVPERPAA